MQDKIRTQSSKSVQKGLQKVTLWDTFANDLETEDQGQVISPLVEKICSGLSERSSMKMLKLTGKMDIIHLTAQLFYHNIKREHFKDTF